MDSRPKGVREPEFVHATMGQWQPIESAPKDGTHILVVRAGENEIEITEWCTQEHFRWEHVKDDLWRKIPEKPYEFWNGNGHRATHWMPLPAPPGEQ